MRTQYSATEHAKMLFELRSRPPRPGESLDDLAWRLQRSIVPGFQRTHRPSQEVIRNLLRAAGIPLRRRLLMRSGPTLLHRLRWHRRPIDLARSTYIEWVIARPLTKDGKDALT